MPLTLATLVPLMGGRQAPAGTGAAAGAGAFTLWLYRTEDAADVVDTAGYFNGARFVLTPGDIILRSTVNSSGVAQTAGLHLVNSVPASGNVDVADALAITTTDTD